MITNTPNSGEEIVKLESGPLGAPTYVPTEVFYRFLNDLTDSVNSILSQQQNNRTLGAQLNKLQQQVGSGEILTGDTTGFTGDSTELTGDVVET